MTRDLTKPILQASAPPAAIVGGLDLGASQKAIDVKPGQNGLPDATLQKSATKAFSKFREELGSGGQNALGQALDGNSTPERSVQAQVLVDQVVERARRDGGMPKVVSAVSVGDVTAAGGPATALPKGVDAAYIPSKNVILVRQGLSGPALQAALAEEFGEWLGALAAKAGVTLAPGDVGARIRAVLAGLTPAPGTFSEAADDGTKVRLNGQVLTARAMAQGFDGTLAFESSDHLWLEYKKGNNWVQIGAQKSAQNTPLGQQAPVVRQKGIAVPADVVPGKTLFRLRLKPLNGDPVITVATNDPGVYGANSTFTQSTSPNGTFRLSLNAWGNGDIARPLLANGQRGPKPDWLILDAAPDSDLTLVLQPKTPVQAPAASNTPSTVSAMVEFGSGNTELRALNPVTQKFDYIANSTAGQNVRRIVTIPRLGKNLPVLRLQEGNKYFYSNKGGSTFTTSAGGNPVIRFETDVKTNAQADAGGFDDLTVTIGPKTLPAAQSVRKAVSAKAVQDALGAVNVAADIASLLPADRGLATFGGDSVATPQTIVTGPQKLFVAKEHRAMVSVVLDAAGFRTYDWLEVQTADGSWKQIASEQPITRDFNRRIFNFVYDRRRGVPKLRFVNKKDKPIEVDPQNNNKNGTGAWKDLGTKPYSSGTNKRTLEFNSAIKVDIITKAAPKYGEGVLIHVDEVPSLGPRQNGSRSNLQYLNANNQWIDFAKSAFGERNWDVGVPIELPLVNGKPPLVRMAQQIVQGSIFNNAQSQNWTYSAPQQLRIDSTSDMFQMVSPLPDKSKDEKYYPYNVPGVAPGNSNRFSLRATSYTFQNGEAKPKVIQQPQAIPQPKASGSIAELIMSQNKGKPFDSQRFPSLISQAGFTHAEGRAEAFADAAILTEVVGLEFDKAGLEKAIQSGALVFKGKKWSIDRSKIASLPLLGPLTIPDPSLAPPDVSPNDKQRVDSAINQADALSNYITNSFGSGGIIESAGAKIASAVRQKVNGKEKEANQKFEEHKRSGKNPDLFTFNVPFEVGFDLSTTTQGVPQGVRYSTLDQSRALIRGIYNWDPINGGTVKGQLVKRWWRGSYKKWTTDPNLQKRLLDLALGPVSFYTAAVDFELGSNNIPKFTGKSNLNVFHGYGGGNAVSGALLTTGALAGLGRFAQMFNMPNVPPARRRGYIRDMIEAVRLGSIGIATFLGRYEKKYGISIGYGLGAGVNIDLSSLYKNGTTAEKVAVFGGFGVDMVSAIGAGYREAFAPYAMHALAKKYGEATVENYLTHLNNMRRWAGGVGTAFTTGLAYAARNHVSSFGMQFYSYVSPKIDLGGKTNVEVPQIDAAVLPDVGPGRTVVFSLDPEKSIGDNVIQWLTGRAQFGFNTFLELNAKRGETIASATPTPGARPIPAEVEDVAQIPESEAPVISEAPEPSPLVEFPSPGVHR